MFNKIMFYILYFLMNSSLEQEYIKDLPQYSFVSDTLRRVFSLSLDNFKSNDILYFEVSFYDGNNYDSILLSFLESDIKSYNKYSDFTNIKSKIRFKDGISYNFYFSYTLKNKKNNLLILTPYFDYKYDTKYILKHIKELPSVKESKNNEDGIDIVGGIICILIYVTSFIALNILLCRIKKKRESSPEQSVVFTNAFQPKNTTQPEYTQPQPLFDQPQTTEC